MPVDRSTTRPVTFIAPAPQAISNYARQVSSEFQTETKETGKDSTHLGFSTFLAFVATKLTKYLNEGHTELLDEFKAKNTRKGGLPCRNKPLTNEP